jgi:hypothetical protein
VGITLISMISIYVLGVTQLDRRCSEVGLENNTFEVSSASQFGPRLVGGDGLEPPTLSV